MDDELRSEKRAEWQARTPLSRRWLISGIIFVIAVAIIIVLALV